MTSEPFFFSVLKTSSTICAVRSAILSMLFTELIK